ncbi:hypothetical protein H2204_004083 [Knufia peltigerae]|uniref:Uncharacterized protein n=1 Tax=Knufia peltigerae TaxID=1002370 RepID=A0AA38Y838_9EURO|nr:hypothetical protein H2204_004083 [Knufia peltigerae]
MSTSSLSQPEANGEEEFIEILASMPSMANSTTTIEDSDTTEYSGLTVANQAPNNSMVLGSKLREVTRNDGPGTACHADASATVESIASRLKTLDFSRNGKRACCCDRPDPSSNHSLALEPAEPDPIKVKGYIKAIEEWRANKPIGFLKAPCHLTSREESVVVRAPCVDSTGIRVDLEPGTKYIWMLVNNLIYFQAIDPTTQSSLTNLAEQIGLNDEPKYAIRLPAAMAILSVPRHGMIDEDETQQVLFHCQQAARIWCEMIQAPELASLCHGSISYRRELSQLGLYRRLYEKQVCARVFLGNDGEISSRSLCAGSAILRTLVPYLDSTLIMFELVVDKEDKGGDEIGGKVVTLVLLEPLAWINEFGVIFEVEGDVPVGKTVYGLKKDWRSMARQASTSVKE